MVLLLLATEHGVPRSEEEPFPISEAAPEKFTLTRAKRSVRGLACSELERTENARVKKG